MTGRGPAEGGAKRLGVLGWPVAHSLSPRIQNAALRAAGLRGWRYQLLPVAPELFDQVVRALGPAGFRGANVTLPHKPAALELATVRSERARAIGAANTLLFEADGSISADNTDAPALIAALPFDITDTTALVLGAGGAARAAVWALIDAGASDVAVWNRTSRRALELGSELGATAVREARPADILVNCTSVGLGNDGSLDGLPLKPSDLGSFRCVVDFVYAERETALVVAAGALDIPTVDGKQLLIGQGTLSFELFTDRPAPVEAMRAALAGPRSPGGGGYGADDDRH